MKQKIGWCVVHTKRNTPIGVVSGMGSKMGISGYVYIHFHYQQAKEEAEDLNESWGTDKFHVVKVKVNQIKNV